MENKILFKVEETQKEVPDNLYNKEPREMPDFFTFKSILEDEV